MSWLGDGYHPVFYFHGTENQVEPVINENDQDY
jgi:hypothetical protein